MANLITQEDLERKIGVRAVAQLSNDQGGTTADTTVIGEVLGEASDIAKGLLWDAFPSDAQIEALVGADKAAKGAVTDLAIGLLGMRRLSLQDSEGKSVHERRYDRAERKLQQIAEGRVRRAKGEATAGRNKQLGVTHNNTREAGKKTIFAATADNPKGPGGF